MKRSFELGLVLVSLAACAPGAAVTGGGLMGSGTPKTETRALGPFTEVEVSSSLALELNVGPAQSVTVTTDDNLLPKLVTEVRGQRLTVRMDAPVTERSPTKVVVTAPVISHVGASGASRATATGLTGPSVTLDASGASRISASGTATSVAIDASGASQVIADQLVAESAKAEASGASTIRVHATKSLEAEASGASMVKYAGHPATVKEDASGASSIRAD